MPIKKSVWKMHPVGLRIFGWAPAPHSLAIVNYALSSQTHGTGVVAQKRDDVLAFIKRHHLTQSVQKGGYLEVFPH